MINGVINIYKEKGYTSHDVVAKLRGILKIKRIGHTGTLDPDAEGVLPVCIGKATGLCGMLTDQDKVYEAQILLGVTTDTQDISGKVLRSAKPEEDLGTILDAIYSFVGEISQIPPMYSACKHNGKKLYELARQGMEVERKPRTVKISSIRIHEYDDELHRIRMTVHCSKGTYIRTLCNDIGEKLGCGACMLSLKRIRVGRFGLDGAITLGQAEAKNMLGTLDGIIIPVDEIFSDLPAFNAASQMDIALHNGNSIPCGDGFRDGMDAPQVRMYDSQNEFIGIYGIDDGYLRPVKMFYDSERK